VTTDGTGVVSHVGSRLLAGLADRGGLTAAFSEAPAGLRERRSGHDPGRVLTDLAVLLADGGRCSAAVQHEPELLIGRPLSGAGDTVRRVARARRRVRSRSPRTDSKARFADPSGGNRT
jgi:hypothetical protein